MSVERQHHESSSSDSVAAQIPSEKNAAEVEPSSPQDQHDVTPTQEENDTENAIEKKESGSPLDRTPSQAAKMGRKKIAVVMTALCVCTPLIPRNNPAMRRKSPRSRNYKLTPSTIVGPVSRCFGYGKNTPFVPSPLQCRVINRLHRRPLSQPPYLQSPLASVPQKVDTPGSPLPTFLPTPPVFRSGERSVIFGVGSTSSCLPMCSSWSAV